MGKKQNKNPPVYSKKNSGRDSLNDGEIYQRFISRFFWKKERWKIRYYTKKIDQFEIGESKECIEVKLDDRLLSTPNVSIEVAEKKRASQKTWIPSGILSDDNTALYIQGNYEIIFLFTKNILKQLYNIYYKKRVWEPKNTLKTFLLPLNVANYFALKVFILNKQAQRIFQEKIKKQKGMNELEMLKKEDIWKM